MGMGANVVLQVEAILQTRTKMSPVTHERDNRFFKFLGLYSKCKTEPKNMQDNGNKYVFVGPCKSDGVHYKLFKTEL